VTITLIIINKTPYAFHGKQFYHTTLPRLNGNHKYLFYLLIIRISRSALQLFNPNFPGNYRSFLCECNVNHTHRWPSAIKKGPKEEDGETSIGQLL